MPQTTPLTPEQIETVKSVYDAIGVLTVRDNVTFPEGKAAEYGKHFAPVRKHMTNGREIRDPLIRHRRVISTVFADSHIFKGGVPIGVTEIWQPKGIAELGGDPTLQLMAHKNDICMSELKRLKSLAYGTKWMSQEERLADERMKEEMRQKRKISDLDPAAATGKALADALATALSNAGISGGGAAVATAAKVNLKQRIVEIEGKRKRRWFVEDESEERLAGPFLNEQQARSAIEELDS